ncbi:peptide methionine sulfoxide reductase 2 [Trichomonascus vanleenenianus]|uniref:peptide-methionine (R)-S-oxide reductase n=1 Tax=Trichomonascus vanleenenianus TaxID=2268995 RepID=UPI003EC9C553
MFRLRQIPKNIFPFINYRYISTSRILTMAYKVQKSDQEWQAILTPEQFRVLRQKGTERPFTNEDIKPSDSSGVFQCAACDSPLYNVKTKFDSGCGWPAFYEAIPGAVELHDDSTLGMQRTEMVCKNCGGHLGHVFRGEGFPTPTNERHCVNGVALKFQK